MFDHVIHLREAETRVVAEKQREFNRERKLGD